MQANPPEESDNARFRAPELNKGRAREVALGFSDTSSLRKATASSAPVMLMKVSIASCGGLAMAGGLRGGAVPCRKDKGEADARPREGGYGRTDALISVKQRDPGGDFFFSEKS
jgi:hypothetical protein